MKYKKLESWRGFKPSVALRRDDEEVVQNGLAVTPAEMEKMAAMGVPISAQASRVLESYDTGDNDYSVPLEFQKGVDPLADGYQFMKETHAKIRSAARDARNKKRTNADPLTMTQVIAEQPTQEGN